MEQLLDRVIEAMNSMVVLLGNLKECLKVEEQKDEVDPTIQPDLPGLFDEEPTLRVITLEDIRAILADVSRKGGTAKVRELLKAHGQDRLSAIPTTEYPALLSEAKDLAKEFEDA